jgi:hypothetical protein
VDKETGKIARMLQEAHGGHILYFSNNKSLYLENAVSFVGSGVKQGDHVMVIENERVCLQLFQKLSKLLTKDQLEMVHSINNFDFYFSKGDFHPQTIVEYFEVILKPYLKGHHSIRTWAHVEWGNIEEISCKIEAFEFMANNHVPKLELISVCAYDAEVIPDKLKAALLRSHDYLMSDGCLHQLKDGQPNQKSLADWCYPICEG